MVYGHIPQAEAGKVLSTDFPTQKKIYICAQLTAENISLSATINRQIGRLPESFFEKLLLGRVQYFDNISELLKMYHIDCEYPYWSCILPNIYEESALFAEDAIDSAEQQKLLLFILENVLGELCQKMHTAYLVQMADCYACVVSSKNSSPLSEKLLVEICTEGSDFLTQKFHLENEVFANSIYWGIEHLPNAYEEAHTSWLRQPWPLYGSDKGTLQNRITYPPGAAGRVFLCDK